MIIRLYKEWPLLLFSQQSLPNHTFGSGWHWFPLHFAFQVFHFNVHLLNRVVLLAFNCFRFPCWSCISSTKTSSPLGALIRCICVSTSLASSFLRNLAPSLSLFERNSFSRFSLIWLIVFIAFTKNNIMKVNIHVVTKFSRLYFRMTFLFLSKVWAKSSLRSFLQSFL